MRVCRTVIETQNYLKSNSIGFVPTMGALHSGHISLIKQAKQENGLCVCSIFVNPTQFNNPEDLVKYPRTLEADLQKLEEAGCDVVFVPEVSEMYPKAVNLEFNFGALEHLLEGKFRPGHFNGVGIVVSKLFHIVKPTRAYFGQKDLQQCAIVNRLVNDLSFGIELRFCDTVRELDGLAMSSRNTRLGELERSQAPFLYQSILEAKKLLTEKQNVNEVLSLVDEMYAQKPEFEIEYFEIVDFETLEKIEEYKPENKTAIVLAAYLGGVRLIDNIVF